MHVCISQITSGPFTDSIPAPAGASTCSPCAAGTYGTASGECRYSVLGCVRCPAHCRIETGSLCTYTVRICIRCNVRVLRFRLSLPHQMLRSETEEDRGRQELFARDIETTTRVGERDTQGKRSLPLVAHHLPSGPALVLTARHLLI